MKSSLPSQAAGRRQRALALSSLLALSATLCLAQSRSAAVEDHPGFVDFARFGVFDEGDLTVEVNLSDSLLNLVAEAVREDEGEFAQLISKLRSIRVNIFKLEAENGGKVGDRLRKVTRELRKEGWEAVVRVHGEEDISILVRLGEKTVVGLVAAFVDDESVGFVNIVGEVDPGQIARIGRQFNIGILEQLDAAAKGPAEEGDAGERAKPGSIP